jgi:hypothetical protein
VSIQALSPDDLASATACSSLAMRADWESFAAAVWVDIWANENWANAPTVNKHNSNGRQTAANFFIDLV